MFLKALKTSWLVLRKSRKKWINFQYTKAGANVIKKQGRSDGTIEKLVIIAPQPFSL